LLCRDVLASLPEKEQSDLADLLSAMAAHGELMGHEVTHRYYEIGSHRGLEETQRYLQARSA
jgi:N-acetyl-alpha-D-muramate 1-phosphate uridylyltransferase